MEKQISINDFQVLDIRIGTIIKAEIPAWSHWVMKLSVDLGEEIGQRTIFAGIMHYYKVEDLEGKQFPFLINIASKKIGPEGDMSQGMLLAATSKLDKPLTIEGEEVWDKPVLLFLKEKVPNGAKVR